MNILDNSTKYTFFDGKNSGEMLIDMNIDRGELQNVITQHPDQAAKLRKAMSRYGEKVISGKTRKN